ncbi:MAG TPA: hypothetical protein VGS15_04940 [Candidatus Acidoferrales bacterium]|nr:hypothetical protein [Candidatus Acidoferrales bacterium]
MGTLRCFVSAFLLAAVLLLLGAAPAFAQETTPPAAAKVAPYNVQQTVEVGFRYVNMGGNMSNYDTFENLNSGARLLDYSLEVTSPDHKGKFFDNISLYNFGYGGDPNDLTHLRVTKSRLYEFTGQFRRDQNFFAYNLLANPLNPSNFTPTPVPITFAPHGLDLVHRMTDLNLTLLPQSRVSFRLGYSRNVNEGPSFTTLDGGTEPQLFQQFKTTMNSYSMGADFKILPRTTFSYDEYLQYFKQDTGWFDQNQTFQLPPPNGFSNGTPVDLGIIFINSSPCKNDVQNALTTPQTANPACNGFLTYSHVARPRTSLPTEHFGFQSSYIHKLTMSGQLSYAKANSYSNDFQESFFGNTVRTAEQLTSQAGPTSAKRVTVVADWAGTYELTDKLRLVDEFGYNNYRIPGAWNFAFGSAFASTATPTMSQPSTTAIAPQSTIAATITQFDANCPAANNYASVTALTCPVHGSSSPADQSLGQDIRFLGQKVKSNKFEVEYDFKPRLGGRLGLGYTSRTIADFNATDFSATGKTELFLPGPGPAPVNPALGAASAQRGDCALVAGALPAGCTALADGAIEFTGDNTDPSRNIVGFNQYSLLAGIWARPTDKLRTSFDVELMSADGSFTRITPRQSQHYRVHATYVLQNWATIDGSLNLSESRDNIQFVNYLAHNRSASFVATLMPHEKYSFDFGYSYNNVFSQALICYNYGFSNTLPPGGVGILCTLPNGPGDINDSTSSDFDRFQTNGFYKDTVHYPYFDFMWKPLKRITSTLGYAATFARGSAPFLNPLQPTGTLSYTYQKPYAKLSFDAGGGISYNALWTYYGYNPRGIQVPVISSTGTSLAVPATGFNGFLQDFNGNTVMFSLRYTH